MISSCRRLNDRKRVQTRRKDKDENRWNVLKSEMNNENTPVYWKPDSRCWCMCLLTHIALSISKICNKTIVFFLFFFYRMLKFISFSFTPVSYMNLVILWMVRVKFFWKFFLIITLSYLRLFFIIIDTYYSMTGSIGFILNCQKWKFSL